VNEDSIGTSLRIGGNARQLIGEARRLPAERDRSSRRSADILRALALLASRWWGACTGCCCAKSAAAAAPSASAARPTSACCRAWRSWSGTAPT